MRIGVLTHSAGDDNYGQILQCYALQQYLKKIGHQPFLIQHEVENAPVPEKLSSFKHALRRIIGYISPSRRKAYAELDAIKKQREVNAVLNKKRKFKQFKIENIELSRFYGTYKELVADPPKADAYIVGSDQVWIPSVNSPAALAWYLQFGDKETKRISYAASIGRLLDESEYEQFRVFLNDFTAVSVRETSGLESCEKAGVHNAQLVLDPTLLVTKSIFESFIEKECSRRPYLFLYYLNVINKEDLAWNQIADFLKEKCLELIPVSSSGYYPAFDLIPGYKNLLLTIPEWLNAVSHADYMVTTSFHGVAFAIMMHCPFVAILLNGMYSGGNGRITSLLDSLGLFSRILSDQRTIKEILSSPIDWDDVDTLLKKQRMESETFILNALK